MAHTVTLEEIENWATQESWFLAASSGGKGSHKKLEMSSGGIFRVTDHEAVVYKGPNMLAAVDSYNAAP